MYYERNQTKSTAFIITLGVSGNIFINPEFSHLCSISREQRLFHAKLTGLDVSVHPSCSHCAVSERGVRI